MPAPRVLFVSGSIGLGHVTRDLRIAGELRRRIPEVSVSWLAGDAARDVIAAAGEPLVPESARYTTGAPAIEAASRGFVLNLASPWWILRTGSAPGPLRGFLRDVKRNVNVFREVTERGRFDLIVGDETFDLVFAFARNPRLRTEPFALICDFAGADAMTRDPFEHVITYLMNRAWARLLARFPPPCDLILFVGEEEDVPDEPFGFLLPSRRESARRAVKFLGYVCPFDPAELTDRASVRARLGYGEEPLVICSIGGTSVGAGLLQLCADAYPLIRDVVPGVRMVLVCGPRLSPTGLTVPPEVEVRGHVDRLYEHFAACDLAIVLGGGTTTLELTALARPFLYFPLEEHFEQQVLVAGRLERHRAGIKLAYSRTTPASLARAIISNIGRKVSYRSIPIDGARKAADFLCELLSSG